VSAARLGNRRGVALVLALWVLVLLSFIGLEMSTFSRADTGSTRYLKERLQTHYLARGGVERGVGMVAEYYERYPANALAAKNQGRSLGSVTEPRPPILTWLADRGIDHVALGDGGFSLRFEDLSGKVNVNRADPTVLANLARLSGLDHSRAEQVTDCILDWVDADDLHRPRGAEKDEYERHRLTLPRNAPVQQLEELLLVKGVTREILYGGGRYKGLAQFLTTEGSGKINVNTAPPEVLLAVPGMDQGIVSRVIAARRTRALRSLQEVLGTDPEGRLGVNPLLGILSFDTTEMRIEAQGELPGSTVHSVVRATVGIMPAGVIVRSWRDDFPAGLALVPGGALLPTASPTAPPS
jgi:general secretion pathway protein K